MSLPTKREVAQALDRITGELSSDITADIALICSAAKTPERRRFIQEWCPLVRPDENHDQDSVSDSVITLRKKLWARNEFVAHRKTKAILVGKPPGWSQMMFCRLLDRIHPFPSCLEESRQEIMAASGNFDHYADNRTGTEGKVAHIASLPADTDSESITRTAAYSLCQMMVLSVLSRTEKLIRDEVETETAIDRKELLMKLQHSLSRFCECFRKWQG